MIWLKDKILILQSINLQTAKVDSRYKIDILTFGLIIDSVNINDTSKHYLCEVSVINPLTGVIRILPPSLPVLLSLSVIVPTPEPPESNNNGVCMTLSVG